MDNNYRRIYRSRTNRTILGVCGGLAEYFGFDPILVRIGVVVVAVFTAVAPVVICYIVAALIIPEEGN
ncbi:MAG: PspC domain-containing protein [Lachnospiraceae bacterium]|jgi:phage shock protein PspC (stress-responsive transcriptional regulator)|nr:PspC domain-containing protein [Lachnospiraceae bacterium]